MSVIINLVRFTSAQQVSLTTITTDGEHPREVTGWEDLCCDSDKLPDSFYTFDFFEIHSHGWQQGTRYRTKRFNTPERAFAYLNKLVSGGWIDDAQYDRAYGALDRLCCKNHRGIYATCVGDDTSFAGSIARLASILRVAS